MAAQSRSHRITAVICTYNRYEVLDDAVRSIESQSLPKSEFELVVVDNSPPSDIKINYWDKFSISCNCQIILEDFPGLSRARNIGIDQADGDYIAFIDDDALASSDWLAAVIQSLDAHEEVAVVGGPVEPIWPSERPRWLHEWQEGYLTIVDRGPTGRILTDTEWLAGTNIAFRTDALKETGGFDVSVGRVGKLLMSNEELFITNKLKALGYKIYYEPTMRVRHRVHAERVSQDWFIRRACWQIVSDILSNQNQDRSVTQEEAKLREFFSKLPIRRRRLASLFQQTDDKAEFQRQLSAIEALARLMLTSGSISATSVGDGI